MVTLSSHEELLATEQALEKLEESYPALFEKLKHIVHLTRSLQFRYQYMGCLLMDENPGENMPASVYESILNLYKGEVQRVKEDQNYQALKQFFTKFESMGYAQISQLILGKPTESLLGGSSIK